MKYIRVGTLSKKAGSQAIIVNMENREQKVDNGLLMVWQKCDGLSTIDEIAEEISEKTRAEKSAVRDEIFRAVAKLERFGLLRRAK